jgi:hypothetical protein
LGQQPLLANKKKVVEAARKLGIPYTLVYANSFAGYFAGNLGQLAPLENDEVKLFETGDVKGESGRHRLQLQLKGFSGRSPLFQPLDPG